MKIKRLICILFIGLLNPIYTYAQSDSSHQLPQIMIKGLRFSGFHTGSFLQNIGLENSAVQLNQSIHQVLSLHSGIYIKNGGPSLLASSATRGSTAQQTSTVWCGIPIESPMLGQTDLSMLPSFLFDGMGILYGAQSSLFGSGNIGGTIQLNHSNQIKRGLHAELLIGMGSFEEYNQGVKLAYAGNKMSAQLKVLNQYARNNFDYEIKGLGSQLMQHANVKQTALMQEFNYTPNRFHSFDFKIWLQQNNRLLPDLIGASKDNAIQNNQFARTIFTYKFNKGNYQLQSRTALFNEYFDYSSITTSLTKTRFVQLSQGLDQTWSFQKHRILLSGQLLAINGFTDNYSAEKSYIQPSVLGTIQSNWWNHKLETQINIRKQWYNQKGIPLIPGFGYKWQIKNWVALSGNIALGFRMPTLNDLYWNPGGNQNLNPEQSKSYETGIIIKHKQLQIRLNAYNRTCTNQITWMANSNGLWYAENTNEVEVNGLELIWQLEKKWSEFQFVFRGQHDYCLALNKDQKSTSTFNKQMMYVPKLKHLVQFEIIHGNYKLQYIHQYVGQRFYTSDNSEALPDYQIGNVFLQKQLNLRILKGLAFQFGIMNCWNQQYQNILNRPMPGRQLNLTINYQF